MGVLVIVGGTTGLLVGALIALAQIRQQKRAISFSGEQAGSAFLFSAVGSRSFGDFRLGACC